VAGWVHTVGGAVAGGGFTQGGDSVVKEERVGTCLVLTSASVSSSPEKPLAGGSALPKKVQGWRRFVFSASTHVRGLSSFQI
jgi:hypothetical protein